MLYAPAPAIEIAIKKWGRAFRLCPESLLAVRLILLADVEVYSVFAVGLGCVGVRDTEAIEHFVLNLPAYCPDLSEAPLPAQVLDELDWVKFYLYLVHLIPFRE